MKPCPVDHGKWFDWLRVIGCTCGYCVAPCPGCGAVR